jgi:hypothetical protein
MHDDVKEHNAHVSFFTFLWDAMMFMLWPKSNSATSTTFTSSEVSHFFMDHVFEFSQIMFKEKKIDQKVKSVCSC